MAIAAAGDIVLFEFPQTDLAVGKLRPTLLVTAIPTQFDDWPVCMISTQTRHAVPEFDETIDASDPDFQLSGLKATSLIRSTRLAVASEQIFVGTVGAISQDRLASVREKIAKWVVDA